MEGLVGNFDIKSLSQLLTPPDQQDSDSDEDYKPSSAISKMNPSDIAPKRKTEPGGKSEAHQKKNEKDIWEAQEVNPGAEYDDVYDPRPQPEYEILYKQSVTTEDMFLQMGNKTPSTASCEDMVVKIQLPDTVGSDVKLDVKDTFLDCRTPKFKLGLHLPHTVDPKTSRAQWVVDKHVLIVTLRMAREYDFVNF
ncbi:hypothetical protein NP493_17g06054 [Ridgeia piscesae]|uniref:PIH1D1/2/3 CS-like domain-containing protein n=1 Tax=Ridgeia piscesae TaxID=27915 RepID=A0AAD9PEC5_RIDPI|nr:hypothetical protein NP493_17g06054 [Ridgeia piscesae]